MRGVIQTGACVWGAGRLVAATAWGSVLGGSQNVLGAPQGSSSYSNVISIAERQALTEALGQTGLKGKGLMSDEGIRYDGLLRGSGIPPCCMARHRGGWDGAQ